jgi:hypothetical protein
MSLLRTWLPVAATQWGLEGGNLIQRQNCAALQQCNHSLESLPRTLFPTLTVDDRGQPRNIIAAAWWHFT